LPYLAHRLVGLKEKALSQEPKRLPGEPNSTAAPVSNPDWVAGGRGNHYGIARGFFALLDWRKRRRANKDRRP
jgi:hypothetical protein